MKISDDDIDARTVPERGRRDVEEEEGEKEEIRRKRSFLHL